MFDGLSISITGSGSVAQSAVRGVREELQDARDAALGLAPGMNAAGESMDETASDAGALSLALRGVSSSADDAEDELSSAGRASATTGTSFSALSASTSGLSLSMGTLGTSLTGIVGILGVLATVATPLVATFGALAAGAGALAGAFGVIIGSGMLAYGQSLVDNYQKQLVQVNQRIERLNALQDAQGGLNAEQTRTLNQLKDERNELRNATTASGALARKFSELKGEIAAAVIPLGQQFVPLISDAVSAIPGLVRSMVAAVGGTEQLQQTLRQLGGIAQDALPALVSGMFALANRALPLLQQFMGYLDGKGSAALEGMLSTAERIGPELLAFGNALVRVTPAVLALGSTILETVLPPLTTLVNIGAGVAGWFMRLPAPVRAAAKAFVVVGGALASLSTVVPVLAGALAGLAGVIAAITSPISLVAAAAVGLYSAWRTNFLGIRDITETAVNDVIGFINGLIHAYNRFAKIDPTRKTLNPLQKVDFTKSGEDAEEEAASGVKQAVQQSSVYQQAGQSAGQQFTAGFQQAASGGAIKSDGLTPAMRTVLKGGVKGYVSDPSKFEDKPTPIRESLFRAMARTDRGATPGRLGVSEQEFQMLMSRYAGGGSSAGSVGSAAASAMPSATSSEGVPSTGLSNLKPIINKFESAVDKFARLMDEGLTVRVKADEEWVDAKIQRHDEQQRRDYQTRRGGPQPQRR